MENNEKYCITAEQIEEFQAQLTHYRVCRLKCNCCGDVLAHINRTKEPQSYRLLTCSCGKVQLVTHIFAYHIIGFPEDYEDLSEKWPEKLDYYIWKAKNQRGLTDEQVDYFLEHCDDWTLLPEYSKHCRTFGSEHALEIIKEEHGVSLE